MLTLASLCIFAPLQTFAFTIRCANVDANGNVAITWDNSGTSSPGFHSWYIYHSTNSAGPFTAIDSTFNYPTTMYNHVGANAFNNPSYYFVAYVFNNSNPVIYSDTIRAIGLNVNNPGNGYANLAWNAIHLPLHTTSSPYYIIYREYPAGIFTKIDSVDARTAPVPMTYQDLISVCDDTIKYKIQVSDSMCISVSPLKGDRFVDLQPPSIPILDSMSVDILGNAIAGWKQNPSLDTKSHVILLNPGLSVLDTVRGYTNTSYSSPVSASSGPVSFVVIAVDSCNNPSAPSSPQSTIFLTSAFDLCARSINLSWSGYDYWGSSPQYEIYRSINGAAETFLGTTTSLFFTDTTLVSGNLFCYRVRAREIAGARSSTSNKSCLTPNFPAPPLFAYLRKVSVINSNEVYVEGYVDAAAQIKGYTLFRSLSENGPFTAVESVDISGVSNVSFVDEVSGTGPFYYYITSYDSCGKLLLNSQVSHTIEISGVANTDYTNDLSWNEYGQWPGGVDHYDVYRVVNGMVTADPIVTTSDINLTAIDSVLNNSLSDGEFCYFVEAIEAPGNPNAFADTSRSNEVCLIQTPIIFIPNAFHPGGLLNDYFYPSTVFVSSEKYSFDIFNRWGENIFHTEDPKSGWDGTTNGKNAPAAVYIYRLKAKNSDGGEIDRVGRVTLIR